uniref:Uncharacterized protein n=1 Tax=Talaromyces marneffei PM1 TaxID=1077442 RepID=A0A093X7G6_TALMA
MDEPKVSPSTAPSTANYEQPDNQIQMGKFIL